jgi:hypothetical protein
MFGGNSVPLAGGGAGWAFVRLTGPTVAATATAMAIMVLEKPRVFITDKVFSVDRH